MNLWLATKINYNLRLDAISRGKEVDNQNPPNRNMSSYYNEEKVQPCHLSSSIYYGGQDVYSHPESTQNSGNSTVSIYMFWQSI